MRFPILLAATALAASAVAQVPPASPFPRTLDLIVLDSDSDGLVRLVDQNQDGDYNDPGEITSFYSPLLSPVVMTNPTGIGTSFDGRVYVTDVSTDVVYALLDLNGDGDANDPGECWHFFDATNAGGLVMQIAYSVMVDALGRVFVSVTNQSSPATPDRILKLEDLNFDGDANDPGEASDYYTVPNSVTPLANSIVTKAAAGPDNNLYYTDVGTLLGQRGVWRLVDLNSDGDCNDPGEASLFWNPGAGNAQYWALAIDSTGVFWVTDHNAEHLWRGVDSDASGTITANEQTLYYVTAASSFWDIALRDDGSVLLADSQNPDKITALRDLDNDGTALGAGEAVQVYDATAAPVLLGVRGAAFLRAPVLDVSPGIVPIGQSLTAVTYTARPFDLAALLLGNGVIAPVALPPWGALGIDPFTLQILTIGLSDATTAYLVPLQVPNTPAAIGTYGLQTLCGDLFRLYLSNAAPVVVTP